MFLKGWIQSDTQTCRVCLRWVFQQLSIGDVCFWTPARCYFVCLEVLQYSRGLFPKHQGPETLEELATQM